MFPPHLRNISTPPLTSHRICTSKKNTPMYSQRKNISHIHSWRNVFLFFTQAQCYTQQSDQITCPIQIRQEFNDPRRVHELALVASQLLYIQGPDYNSCFFNPSIYNSFLALQASCKCIISGSLQFPLCNSSDCINHARAQKIHPEIFIEHYLQPYSD